MKNTFSALGSSSKKEKYESFSRDSIEFVLDHEITEQLKIISKTISEEIYVVIVSVINVLLSKYTAQDDIIIGSHITELLHTDLEADLEPPVSVFPIRNYPKSNKRYEAFLREIKETIFITYKNQNFNELVSNLDLLEDRSRDPLLSIFYIHDDIRDKKANLEHLLTVKPLSDIKLNCY